MLIVRSCAFGADGIVEVPGASEKWSTLSRLSLFVCLGIARGAATGVALTFMCIV